MIIIEVRVLLTENQFEKFCERKKRNRKELSPTISHIKRLDVECDEIDAKQNTGKRTEIMQKQSNTTFRPDDLKTMKSNDEFYRSQSSKNVWRKKRIKI